VNVVEGEVPPDMMDTVREKRAELLERLADVDEEIGKLFLMEEEPTVQQLLGRGNIIICH
jgi:elongation factor G